MPKYDEIDHFGSRSAVILPHMQENGSQIESWNVLDQGIDETLG